jgi:hypothetical protein
MKEIEGKFTGVHGSKTIGGIDPTPPRTCFAGGTADPGAWESSGCRSTKRRRQRASVGHGGGGEE